MTSSVRFDTAFQYRCETSLDHPTQVGMVIRLGIDQEEGMVTDETACCVFIEHTTFTGWLEKTEFWDRLGRDDYGAYLA